uniref:LSM family member 14B n=1 Tax=Astatotilapia calliptera TaxID=8154 RepID=A0A3P8RIN7_ASTCA
MHLRIRALEVERGASVSASPPVPRLAPQSPSPQVPSPESSSPQSPSPQPPAPMPGGGFDVSKHIKMVPAFRETEVDSYFTVFERIAGQNRRQPKGTRRTNIQTTRVAEATMQSDPSRFTFQDSQQQNAETRPPARKRQGPRRHRDRRRGQLMVANAPSPTLKFDTDFDFDSSNAQFIKEALEKKLQEGLNLKDGNSEGREKEGLQLSSGEDHFGPKCYYDKAKFFFDNISSDNGLRLTWAGERKRNLETFGVPGRFLRGQGFRGGRQCFGGGCSARAGG